MRHDIESYNLVQYSNFIDLDICPCIPQVTEFFFNLKPIVNRRFSYKSKKKRIRN